MKKKVLADELKKIAGIKYVLTAHSECLAYSRDMSIYSAVPDAVVLPGSAEEVRRILMLASMEKIPVTPRGAGTSVTGAVIPVEGGLVIDLSRMNKIKEINRLDKYAIVEPGVICKQLNIALEPDYFFPPDPGSLAVATIGGMISTNASGRSALKYGTTADYLLKIEAVLSSGEIIHPGHITPKSSAGFDLSRLFISSEGTLGVITEATLRIVVRPEANAMLIAGFPTLHLAAEASVHMVSGNIPMRSCELLDCVSIQEFIRNTGLAFHNDVQGMLIIETDGESKVLPDRVTKIRDICNTYGATDTYPVYHHQTMENIWRSRYKLVTSLNSHMGHSRLVPMAEDIGVPVTKIPEALDRTKKLSEKYDIPVVLFGHAGDGNIHTTYILNPLDKKVWTRARDFTDELNSMAMELGGTISGEHGIGLSKIPFLAQEVGAAHLVMKKIKHVLDPLNIMNPGKLGFSEKNRNVFDDFAFLPVISSEQQDSVLTDTMSGKNSVLCMMCGNCRAVCPVFSVTGLESDNARGKVQLFYSLQTGKIRFSRELARTYYLCTNCAACEQNCPSGIDVTGLVDSARQKMCEHDVIPESVNDCLLNLKKTGNFYGNESGRLFWSKSQRTLFYSGCTAGMEDAGISFDLFDILGHAGIDHESVDYHESCCGLPQMLAGDKNAFSYTSNKLASTIRKLAPDTIVTSCPGCMKALCDYYPDFVTDWNFNIKSAVEYVQLLVISGKIKFSRPMTKKVIYHDPCYLGRHMGIFEQPREILNRIPGLSLLEFEMNRERSFCCGGPLMAIDPDVSISIAANRIEQAVKAGAHIIVTACPTCKKQLKKGIPVFSEKKYEIEILNIMDIVGMAMKEA